MTQVVNIKSGDQYDVYIGRSGKGIYSEFGNPFPVPQYSIFKSLKLYELHLRNRLIVDPDFKSRLLALDGKRLGCFCKPNLCHGDVIIKLINELKNDLQNA